MQAIQVRINGEYLTPAVISVKDIIAHFASFKCILIDALNIFYEGGPTPYFDHYTRSYVQRHRT